MDLQAFKRRRGGHRAQVTRLISSVGEELAKDFPSPDILEMYKNELVRQRSKIQALGSDIQEVISEELDLDISDASDFAMNVEVCIRQASARVSNRSSQASEFTKAIKLPNIMLPHFDGNAHEWSNFGTYFVQLFMRADIGSATKFQYLSSQLHGEAANLISGFNQTAKEYEEAVKLLTSTFGRPQLLIQSRLWAFFDLKSPPPTAKSLSEFRSTFEGQLRALKSMDCDIEHSGYVYADLLLRSLPHKLRDNINRTNSNNVWNLENYAKQLLLKLFICKL